VSVELDELIQAVRGADPARGARIPQTADPAAIRAANPRRRTARPLAVAAACAAVIGGAVFVVATLPKGDEEPPPPVAATTIGILDRAAGPADRLPGWVTDSRQLRADPRLARTARLAGVFGNRRVWVARGTDDRVCTIDVLIGAPAGAGDRGAVSCGSARALDTSLIVSPLRARAAKPWDLMGVAPDGFDTARSGSVRGEVRNNVYVLRGVRVWDPVVATGSAGARRAWTGITAPGPQPRGPNPRLRVSLLERPPVPDTRLPARIRRAVRDEPGRRAWRATPVGSTQPIWILTTLRPTRPGRHGVTISGGTVGGFIWPTRQRPASMATVMRAAADGTLDDITLSGIAGDGYDTLTVGDRSVPIRDNVFEMRGLRGPEPLRGVFSGPAGEWTTTTSGSMALVPRSILRPPRRA